jgi:hypothetical protein
MNNIQGNATNISEFFRLGHSEKIPKVGGRANRFSGGRGAATNVLGACVTSLRKRYGGGYCVARGGALNEYTCCIWNRAVFPKELPFCKKESRKLLRGVFARAPFCKIFQQRAVFPKGRPHSCKTSPLCWQTLQGSPVSFVLSVGKPGLFCKVCQQRSPVAFAGGLQLLGHRY